MKRIINKAKNNKEAEAWDIRQCIQMSIEERQEAALELKRRVFGKKTLDVREFHKR